MKNFLVPLLIAVLTASLASANATFEPAGLSVGQAATISSSIDSKATGFYVYLPDGWTRPSSSDAFSCPRDWTKDAAFGGYLHCVCASPCKDYDTLVKKIKFDTVAPQQAGNYSWRVVAYNESGVAVNETITLTVKTPAMLSLALNQSSGELVKDETQITFSLQLENAGESAAMDVETAIGVRDSFGADVSGQFFFEPSSFKTARLEANSTVAYSARLDRTTAAGNNYQVVFSSYGVDANSGSRVGAERQTDFVVLHPAELAIYSVSPNESRVSFNQPFNVNLLLTNFGGADAADYSVDLEFYKQGKKVLFEVAKPELAPIKAGELATIKLTARAVGEDASGKISIEPVVSYSTSAGNTRQAKEGTVFTNASITVEAPPKIALAAKAGEARAGESFTLYVTVSNKGSASLLESSVKISAAGLCVAEGDPEIGTGVIASGGAPKFSAKMRALGEGKCTVTISARGVDANSGSKYELSKEVDVEVSKAGQAVTIQPAKEVFIEASGSSASPSPEQEQGVSGLVSANSNLLGGIGILVLLFLGLTLFAKGKGTEPREFDVNELMKDDRGNDNPPL